LSRRSAPRRLPQRRARVPAHPPPRGGAGGEGTGPALIDIHAHLPSGFTADRSAFYRPDLDFSSAGLLREMDAESIGHALLLQTFGLRLEETVREARARFQESRGRLLPSSTVDPTRGEDEVARAIDLWEKTPELVAIKLYPGYLPFYPHDTRLDPVYEFAARRKLLLMIHSGDTSTAEGRVKFARPVEVDEVAVRFREVRFVLCHLGNPWLDEGAEVVYKNPNVWGDTSGLLGPPSLRYFPQLREVQRHRLQRAITLIGRPEKILYGSDWPLESMTDAVNLIRQLEIPEEDRELILGGNARGLLGRWLDARS
jgi:uncharacterized protein